MKTLALDISTVETGWALFDGQKLMEYGTVKPLKDFSQTEKYFYITQYVATLIRIFRPTDLAIEDTFYSKDPTVLKKLNRIAGQIMYIWYTISRKEPYFYMASSARTSLGVSGHAKKEEIVEAVNKFFKLRGRVKNHNMADAIVIGYHHWRKSQLEPTPEKRRAKYVRARRNN